MEAWVQLDNLEQRGGGAITLQTPDGVQFDSIVFGEQVRGNGSQVAMGLRETVPSMGLVEKEAKDKPVHIAIVYEENGMITGYRDGEPYGNPYQSNGPLEFVAGKSVVTFGVRHLPANGNRMLDGRIFQAQLYNKAMSKSEVVAARKDLAVS